MDLRQLFATNLRRLRSAARQSKIGIRLGFLDIDLSLLQARHPNDQRTSDQRNILVMRGFNWLAFARKVSRSDPLRSCRLPFSSHI
jgi:hypothetical protein